MYVAKFSVRMAKKRAPGNKNLAAFKFHSAKTAFSATAAHVHPDSCALKARKKRFA